MEAGGHQVWGGVIVEQPRAILLVYVLEMISGLGIQFLGRA